jgi:hypothetical protein
MVQAFAALVAFVEAEPMNVQALPFPAAVLHDLAASKQNRDPEEHLFASMGACASLILPDDLSCRYAPGLHQADRVAAAAYEAKFAHAAVGAAVGAAAAAAAAVAAVAAADVAVNAPDLEIVGLFERLAAGQQHDASTDWELGFGQIDCAASAVAVAVAAADGA